jgi:hypothetical protein
MAVINNCAGLAGGILGSTAGVYIGGVIGAFLGPIGSTLGATLGCIVGSIAASVSLTKLAFNLFGSKELAELETENKSSYDNYRQYCSVLNVSEDDSKATIRNRYLN